MKWFFTEPLFRFIILGTLLYFTVSFIQSRRESRSREIVIDRRRVLLLITNYRDQTGQLPDKQQLDAMINNYVKEEIFCREARKSGLDEDDEVIRRRLAQKFEFIHSDLAQVATPGEEQLRRFYKNNLLLFRSDTTVSFSHIYFSTDNSSGSIAKQRAIKVLQQLKNVNLEHAGQKGDHFPLQFNYTDQSSLDIKETFGDKPILDSLFHSPLKTWIGPVLSGYGWHLLFISKRSNGAIMPYQSAKVDVKKKYLEVEQEELNREVFEKLSKNYVVKENYLEK